MSNSIPVPSNPTDRKKLQDGIREIVDSMARIQGEKDYIKESLTELSEKFEIEKKYIGRMAKDAFKDIFKKECQEFGAYAELYEAVMLNQDIDDNEENDDDE